VETIRSTTSLAELQQVVADHGHRMNNVNVSVVIQQVPKVGRDSQLNKQP
jgi:2C-methyl-D-erythritol 2,4-cyclodiphosphate synthase